MESDHQQHKDEKMDLIEADAIPEQKDYSPVAEVLAESIVAAESFWHATVRYINSFDERHSVRQRAWEKTAEVGSMAMANPYVATAVTKVSEGVEAANTIYAQTMELVQEKRRGLMDAFSTSSTATSTSSAPSDIHNSLVVAVHTNDDDLHAEQQQQQAQDPFVEPQARTLDIQVNPDY